jgi:stage V sporulation protein B
MMIKEANKEKKIINGALVLMLSSLLVKAVGLIYKIPLSYILGDDGMSYFNSAYTVYTFFYIICTAGIPKSISIITSDYCNKGEIRTAKRIVKVAFNVFLIFGTVITVLFIILSGVISDSIGNSGARASMITVAPSIAFICASGVLRGYYNGSFLFLPIAVSEIITALSRLVFGILFAMLGARLGYGIEMISAFTLLGGTLGSTITFLYLLYGHKSPFHKEIAGQSCDKKIKKSSVMREILIIATPITLTGALSSISAIFDLSLIFNLLKKSGYTELQANTIYGNFSTLVTPMLNLVASLIAPITTVLLPTVSSLKNDMKQL